MTEERAPYITNPTNTDPDPDLTNRIIDSDISQRLASLVGSLVGQLTGIYIGDLVVLHSDETAIPAESRHFARHALTIDSASIKRFLDDLTHTALEHDLPDVIACVERWAKKIETVQLAGDIILASASNEEADNDNEEGGEGEGEDEEDGKPAWTFQPGDTVKCRIDSGIDGTSRTCAWGKIKCVVDTSTGEGGDTQPRFMLLVRMEESGHEEWVRPQTVELVERERTAGDGDAGGMGMGTSAHYFQAPR